MFVIITYSHISKCQSECKKGINVEPECENPSCRATKRGFFWGFYLFVRICLKVVIEKKNKEDSSINVEENDLNLFYQMSSFFQRKTDQKM